MRWNHSHTTEGRRVGAVFGKLVGQDDRFASGEVAANVVLVVVNGLSCASRPCSEIVLARGRPTTTEVQVPDQTRRCRCNCGRGSSAALGAGAMWGSAADARLTRARMQLRVVGASAEAPTAGTRGAGSAVPRRGGWGRFEEPDDLGVHIGRPARATSRTGET